MLALDSRRHKFLFHIVAAAIAAGFTFAVTEALPYYPTGWNWLVTLLVGGLWLLRPKIGLLVTLLAFLPIIAYHSASLLLLYCLLFILIGIAGAFGFLVLAFGIVALLTPELRLLMLAVPLLAGFLGPRRGAFVGGLTCFVLEIIILLAGPARIGLLTTGQETAPLVTLRTAPVASLLDFSWLSAAGDGSNPLWAGFGSGLNVRLLTPFMERPVLLAQIALWAAVAGIAGALLARPSLARWRGRLLAIGVGALLAGLGSYAAPILIAQDRVALTTVAASTALSAVLVLLASPALIAAPEALAPRREAEEPGEETVSRKEKPADRWEQLAGIDDIKAELIDAIKSQFDPKVRSALVKMNLRPTRGILLYGPPGTGKTRLARIIAHEAGAAFFAVSGTEFTSKWYGESEANLRHIFDEAQGSRPAVLFFDELEAFLPKRTELSRSDAPEKGIVATFLAYTDGIADLDGVLLVGATNYPDLIDAAALRPGRFDKLIYLSPPDRAARRRILERYLKDKPLAPDVDLDKLTARLERFTGADIQAACEGAVKAVLQRGSAAEPMTMADLERAVGGIKPSVTIKMLREYEALADQYGRRAEKAAAVEVVARPALHWSDVAGLPEVKEALHEAIELPLAHPELFTEYGVKPSKGVLLYGPPGCGKTFLARVVASEAKAHFLHVKGPELLQQGIGASEAQLRDVFVRARENTPCVLFFDEIDALAGARGTSESTGTKILTQFLTEMDGVEELKGVIVLAATNRPDTLDPALLRPGRFDRVLYVPPPDGAARAALFRKELSGKPVADDLDPDRLAALTDGYSAADIAALCNAAAMAAAKDALRAGERRPITQGRLLDQIAAIPRSLTAAQLAAYEAVRSQLQRG